MVNADKNYISSKFPILQEDIISSSEYLASVADTALPSSKSSSQTILSDDIIFNCIFPSFETAFIGRNVHRYMFTYMSFIQLLLSKGIIF